MIELKNVTKKFGDFSALDSINFKIEKGEIVGFLGQNGAGKTTTMKIITGLLEPTEGEVLINDEKLDKNNSIKIGYMPENTPLYETLTVREFIDFMGELKSIKKQERKKQIEELMETLNISEVKNKLIKNISRGYKQRVSLAGALIGNPEILVLDEPTVGLDPIQIVEIRNLIKSLKKRHTILLSSHILSEINQICEKVIIIEKGKIVAVDTPSNLERKLSENTINLIIEDPEDKIKTVKEHIPEIESIEFIRKVNSREKEYTIKIKNGVDIRKKLNSELSKLGIIVIELRKSESTLEQVFMNFIETEGEK